MASSSTTDATSDVSASSPQVSIPGWLREIDWVDSHVHIVDLKGLQYNAVEFTTVPALAQQWSEDMYKQDCGDVCPSKLVFLEVDAKDGQLEQEVKWVAPMCQSPQSLFSAIVTSAPVEKGGKATADYLTRLGSLVGGNQGAQNAVEQKGVAAGSSSAGPVRGVRRLIQDRADGACVEKEWLDGVEQVVQRGLVFEICIRGGSKPNQFNDALQMVHKIVRRVPDAIFVLDHMGKPDIKERKNFDQWRDFIIALASYKNNTICKISGAVTEADAEKWTTADIEPFVTHCLTSFSFERCMFGSDWFVNTLAGGRSAHRRWLSSLCSIVDGMNATPQQKAALFRGTATRVYKLA